MKHYARLATVLLITTLAACVVAPEQAPPQYPAPQYPAPAPGPVVYPAPAPAPIYYEQHELQRCHADNRRAHTEVLELYNRAQGMGRISAAEAQYFTQLQLRLNNINAQLNRGGMNLQECQYISGVLASDRKEVLRMSRAPPVVARPDPAIARCVADNRAAHDSVHALYNDGVRTGRITAGEAQRFAVIEKRLAEYQAQSRRDGLSLAECQNISRSIARERAAVDSMRR